MPRLAKLVSNEVSSHNQRDKQSKSIFYCPEKKRKGRKIGRSTEERIKEGKEGERKNGRIEGKQLIFNCHFPTFD